MIGVDDVADLKHIPFLRGGRSRTGIDCLGLVLEVCRRGGLAVADPWKAIEARWDAGERDPASLVGSEWEQIELGEARVLDVVLFRGAGAQHVAPLLDAGWVLHTTHLTGSILTPLSRLRHRVLSAWRWKGAS